MELLQGKEDLLVAKDGLQRFRRNATSAVLTLENFGGWGEGAKKPASPSMGLCDSGSAEAPTIDGVAVQSPLF